MHEDLSAKSIAVCFGLAAFIVAILAGIFVDNPVDAVLAKAIPAMFLGWLVGLPIGHITTRALNQNIVNAAEAAKHAAEAAAAASAEIARLEDNRGDSASSAPSADASRKNGSASSPQPTARKAA